MAFAEALLLISTGALTYLLITKTQRAMELGKKIVEFKNVISDMILSLILWVLALGAHLSILTKLSAFIFVLDSLLLSIIFLLSFIEFVFSVMYNPVAKALKQRTQIRATRSW